MSPPPKKEVLSRGTTEAVEDPFRINTYQDVCSRQDPLKKPGGVEDTIVPTLKRIIAEDKYTKEGS